MKCTNCGIEIPDQSKFCQECGAPIPLEKICLNCGIKLPFGAKFCIECGTSFIDNPKKTSDGLNLGDKNVIAGDVLGSKNDYNISGNTIIYKNEDETKKILSCSICGKHVSNSQGHNCPKCGKFVCSDHFNSEANQCIICTKNDLSAVESEYLEVLEQVYADGIVNIEERKKLSMLKEKLGLSEKKASELESRFSNSMVDNSTELTRSEKIILNDARNMVLYQFKLQEAVTLLSKFREEHEYDELSLKLYLYAFSEYNKENALEYLDSILENYNICAAYICKIDVLLKIGKINEAEKLLNLAKKYYGGDTLLLAKEVEVLCCLYNNHGLESLKEEIQSLTSSLPEGSSEWEKAGIMFTKALVAKTFGDNDTFQKIAADYTIESGNVSFFFERIKKDIPEVTNDIDESELDTIISKVVEEEIRKTPSKTKTSTKPKASAKPKINPQDRHKITILQTGKYAYTGDSSIFRFTNANMTYSDPSYELEVSFDRIDNQSNWETGDLKFCIWLCKEPYNGGKLNNVWSWSCDKEKLQIGYGFPNVKHSVTLPTTIEPGNYYVVFTVNELCSDGNNYIQSWLNFNNKIEIIPENGLPHSDKYIKRKRFYGGSIPCKNCNKYFQNGYTYDRGLCIKSAIEGRNVYCCSIECAKQSIIKGL